MKVIAVANRKGGVGKTTTAHMITAGLSLYNYRTLAVDLDAQRNLTGIMRASGTAFCPDSSKNSPAGADEDARSRAESKRQAF